MIKTRDPVTTLVTESAKRNAKSNAARQAAFRQRQRDAAWEPPAILIGECVECVDG